MPILKMTANLANYKGYKMLKDRRVLLEHDLKIAQEQAAKMYLDIVVSRKELHSDQYQVLREQVADLQFDLDIVNQLILKGHE